MSADLIVLFLLTFANLGIAYWLNRDMLKLAEQNVRTQGRLAYLENQIALMKVKL